MGNEEWLKTVKAGDVVVIDSGFGYREYEMAKIDRITPTQIAVGNQKFRKENGRRIGGSGWHTSYLRELTPELMAVIRRKRSLARLNAENWAKYDDATLLAVVDLLVAYERATKADAVDPVAASSHEPTPREKCIS